MCELGAAVVDCSEVCENTQVCLREQKVAGSSWSTVLLEWNHVCGVDGGGDVVRGCVVGGGCQGQVAACVYHEKCHGIVESGLSWWRVLCGGGEWGGGVVGCVGYTGVGCVVGCVGYTGVGLR